MKKISKIVTIASLLLLGAPLIASASTLAVSPSSGSYGVGSTFNVDIMLDTKGAAIDGVDIYRLHFNPAILQVVDANPTVAGVQIYPGTILPTNVVNTVDNTAGTVTFSQITSGGTKYTGKGELASINFKAMAAGTAKVTFDFTKGKTNDTNVAGNSTDTLTAVTNGSYIISTTASQTQQSPQLSNQVPGQEQALQDQAKNTTNNQTNPTTASSTPSKTQYLWVIIGIVGLAIIGFVASRLTR